MKTVIHNTLSVCLLCVLTQLCFADNEVTREYSFSTRDIEEIVINGSVGSMVIETWDRNEIQLVLEIEGNREGLFRKQKDVDDVELLNRVSRNKLVLEQVEDNTNTDWYIKMPAVADTSLSLGVGSIKAELSNTSVDIDIGVGEVEVSIPASSTGRIYLAVGVGGIELDGADNVDKNRAIVAEKVRAQGRGNFPVRIDVGVGAIEMDLN